MRWMLGRGAVTVVALGVTVAVAASTAGATGTLDRLGTAPAIPLFSATSMLPAATQLHITVSMRPQDASGLQALATAVSTPGSPEFRQYLTVPQFASRFGATQTALSAVESELVANGLTVGDVPANHLTIPASGTAAQIERAFAVSMQQVKLASGRTAFANAQAPALPATVAQYVQGVVGLDDLNPPQPAGLELAKRGRLTDPSIRPSSAAGVKADLRPQVAMGGPQPCTDATGEQSTFESDILANFGVQAFPQTADQAAAAYAFPPLYQAGDLGAGQTIAVFELQSYDPTDISTYQTCYGTSVPITNVAVDSASPTCASSPCPHSDGEAALDIEQVIGLAPQSHLLVYDAPASFNGLVDEFSAIVSQNRAREISSSFGGCEAFVSSVIATENTLLQEAAAQGQSFFASSGDSGAEMCSQAGTQNFDLSVEDPSGQPFATGVGGTTLTNDGPPPTEAVWNDGTNPECKCTGNQIGGGTGGGISNFWSMASYQSGAPAALGVINSNSSATPCNGGANNCREVPDVSADGDLLTGYVIFHDGFWDVIGGTSASAPLWAAYTALVNASAGCQGKSVGFANPVLYQLAGHNSAANFNDVTAASPYTGFANNDTFDMSPLTGVDPNNLFPITGNYDMTTGLGTPNGSTLATSLCHAFAVSVTNPGAQSSVVGQPVAVAVPGSDSGGIGLSFAASGLPAGLTINAATGLISGTPTAPGTSSVTVSATDAFSNDGATQFTWTVTQPPPPPPPPPPSPPVVASPTLSGASLTGLANRHAKLKFTLHAGSNAPALKAVRIALPGGLGLVTKHKTLLKGISVKGAKFKAQVTGGKLTLTFANVVGQVTITISPPAITVAKSLAAQARDPKHKKVTVILTAIDASGLRTTLLDKLPL
jgi:subtilase family serine protease